MLAPRHIGGRMLTSAGHWKELVHLGGVSEEALLRVAERACAGLWSGEVMREITLREKVRKFHAQELVSIWDINISRISCGLLILECVPLIVNIMKGAFKTSHLDFLQIRGRVSQMKAPSLWELKELLHKLFQACDSPCWGYYGKEYSTNLGAQLQLDLNRH